MNGLTIENAHLYLEEFYGVPEQPEYDWSKCHDCGTALEQAEYFHYCPDCGTIDFDKPIYVDKPWTPPPALYKRRQYCIDKLNLMAGYKSSRAKQYTVMLKKLKDHDFESLKELKKLMKQMKYNRYYKFIYNVWFDLKKERLIHLTYNQIDTLANQFIELESKFKNNVDHKRQNMLAYNSVIYYLMRKNKIKGYDNILLPINHIVVCKILKQII